MAKGEYSKDVEYCVASQGAGTVDFYTHGYEPAAARALGLAISHGSAILDVLIHSEAGARTYGGEDAVEQYREDPEASVFERFEIKVNAVGRVP